VGKGKGGIAREDNRALKKDAGRRRDKSDWRAGEGRKGGRPEAEKGDDRNKGRGKVQEKIRSSRPRVLKLSLRDIPQVNREGSNRAKIASGPMATRRESR